MLRVLVANTKGGCGKTMIATNLAAAYAHAGFPTVLMDCDPQASAQRWNARRAIGSANLQVQPLVAGEHQLGHLWSLRIPTRTRVLIVDAPAGLEASQLGELCRRCDHLLVPVLPSLLDLDVAVDFLERIARLPDLRSGRVRTGLIANRVRRNTRSSQELITRLSACEQPLIAIVPEAQAYVQAAAVGYGLAELSAARCRELASPIRAIMQWLPAPDRDSVSSSTGQADTIGVPPQSAH